MKAQLTSVDDHISQDPDVFVGKLVIKGTRIPVERVIDQLAHNPELAELFAAGGSEGSVALRARGPRCGSPACAAAVNDCDPSLRMRFLSD